MLDHVGIPVSDFVRAKAFYTQALATDGVHNFRLPSGFESDRYRVKLQGSGRFVDLKVAQSFRELSQA